MTPREEWVEAAMAIYRFSIGDGIRARLRAVNGRRRKRLLSIEDVEATVREALALPNGGISILRGGGRQRGDFTRAPNGRKRRFSREERDPATCSPAF